MTVEGEAMNATASSSYMIETSPTDPDHQWVGYFEAGSYLCYDDIDMTGVRSIDFQYARQGGLASFQIVLDDPQNGLVLAEQQTEATGGWSTFQNMNVGLDEQVQGRYRLCFVGNFGSGIFNLDYFSLSDLEGTNTGPIGDSGEIPEGQNVPAITTQGNQVLFGGTPDSIAGMSLFWSTASEEGAPLYTAEAVKALKEDWGAELVRAAMGVDPTWGSGDPMTGYTLNEESKLANTLMVTEVVNAAIENGMYVIIDWHTHHAEDHTDAAVEFFSAMAEKYGDYNNVIYEIYNEPLNVSWSGVIKPYAEEVISAIRQHDDDNLIVVGTRTWSQRVDEASLDPINDVNVAYTLHFYAGTHGEDVRGFARTALANGIPLFVTEWGTTAADGGSTDRTVYTQETAAWMNFLRDNGISHANWSLAVKDEEASALTPDASFDGQWSDSELTESGRLVKDIISNW